MTFNTDGSYSYSPDRDFHGADEFSFRASDGELDSMATVSITVDSVNDTPVAEDDAYSVRANHTLTVAAPGLVANDSDVDSDSLTLAHLTQALHGTVTAFDDGSFAYTPNIGFIGTDVFTYVVTDGIAESVAATVTISVLDETPVAVDDEYSVRANQHLNVPAPGCSRMIRTPTTTR